MEQKILPEGSRHQGRHPTWFHRQPDCGRRVHPGPVDDRHSAPLQPGGQDRPAPLSGSARPKDMTSNPPIASSTSTHPRGSITDLGFGILDNPVHIRVSLDPANHYAITSKSPTSTRRSLPSSRSSPFGGSPPTHSHDSERCQTFSAATLAPDTKEECATDAERMPFLSVPSQCEARQRMRLHHYDSWQHIGVFGPEHQLRDAGQDDRLRQAPLRTRRRNRTDRQTGQHADRPRRPRQDRPERKP